MFSFSSQGMNMYLMGRLLGEMVTTYLCLLQILWAVYWCLYRKSWFFRKIYKHDGWKYSFQKVTVFYFQSPFYDIDITQLELCVLDLVTDTILDVENANVGEDFNCILLVPMTEWSSWESLVQWVVFAVFRDIVWLTKFRSQRGPDTSEAMSET